VERLRQSDLERALGFLREAEAVRGPNAFPSELLDRFRELVPCEQVSYAELDRPGKRLLRLDGCSRANSMENPPDVDRVVWQFAHQDPIGVHQERTLDFAARKMSDFVTRRQLHRLEWYTEYLRWFEVEYEICVGLPAPPTHTKVVKFASATRDFSERDRSLLDLLRPHLVHLYESAKTRRLAAALAAGADASGELVVLDSRGEIDFATERAHALLAAYTDGGALVADWLRHERTRLNGNSFPAPGAPLVIERGPYRLVVRRLSDDPQTLLLTEETAPGEGVELLTAREREILGLVEEGKTNAEIAAALWISPATVRTHLENVYAKLDVNSRTAALARLRRPGLV
jgi:DNA-binding CsgD family transcriptional regulator